MPREPTHPAVRAHRPKPLRGSGRAVVSSATSGSRGRRFDRDPVVLDRYPFPRFCHTLDDRQPKPEHYAVKGSWIMFWCRARQTGVFPSSYGAFNRLAHQPDQRESFGEPTQATADHRDMIDGALEALGAPVRSHGYNLPFARASAVIIIISTVNPGATLRRRLDRDMVRSVRGAPHRGVAGSAVAGCTGSR